MKIEEYIREKRSFTIDIENNTEFKPKNGYLVSITNNEISTETDIFQSIVKVCEAVRLINKTGRKTYLGGWYDTRREKYFLDISLHETYEGSALLMGLNFNQSCIYNIESGKMEVVPKPYPTE
jgi:hypothetical protein